MTLFTIFKYHIISLKKTIYCKPNIIQRSAISISVYWIQNKKFFDEIFYTVCVCNKHTHICDSKQCTQVFASFHILLFIQFFFVSLVVVVVPQPAIFLISISNFTYKRTQYSFIHTFIDRSKQIKTKIISIIYSFPFFSPKTCGTMNKLFNKI